jgi:phosphonopyruvate decarboxylase
MIETKVFGDSLKKNGFNFYAGVPCSYQKDLINYAINYSSFVMSSNEGDAIASCAGAYYAGKKPVVLMQNSGLGNAVSPLTSLTYNYKIPMLGFISLRGEPGTKDEPQHKLMGEITCDLLDLMKINWAFLNNNTVEAINQIKDASQIIKNKDSFFFVIRKNSFAKLDLIKELKENSSKLKRVEVLKLISSSRKEDTVLIATTGKTGRELFQLNDNPKNFYMTGSMGCLSSFSLGISKNSSKNVIAIDGDGSLIMRMGNLSTIGYYKPKNLLHILLDNLSHDSTGGQFSTSLNTDFKNIAKSCGYSICLSINSIADLELAITNWHKEPRLTFIHVNILSGSISHLGRPTLSPNQMSDRFKQNFN